MHFVYLLECSDGSLYTGYTTDVNRRVKEHNTAKVGARYTRSRQPVVLRHMERFKSIGKALTREAHIKHMSRKEKLALIKTARRKYDRVGR